LPYRLADAGSPVGILGRGNLSKIERRTCRFLGWPFDVISRAGKTDKRSEATLENGSEGERTMRFMVIIKATPETEANAMPSTELLEEMTKYNEELVKAGVMLAGEGLHPSSKGARVKFSGNQRTVIDGPFAEAKELVAGYWIWQVKSKEEAIEWAKRIPNPTGEESEVELRQVFEAEDFGAEFTPELREREERLRAQAEGKG
jgi:hypothetical protein